MVRKEAEILFDFKPNSSTQSIAQEIVSRLWLIYAGWVTFFLFSTVHCCFDKWAIKETHFNLSHSGGHIALNWGVWLLATPFLLFFLSFAHARNLAWILRGLLLATIAVSIIAGRVAYDVLAGPGELTSSIVYFSPGYAIAMIAILATWQIFYRTEKTDSSTDVATLNLSLTSHKKLNEIEDAPAAIWIDKGASRTRVSLPSIMAIKSAGNYLEVVTKYDTSLTRGSLNNFLEELNDPDLVRVHRSIAVRKSKIQKIKSLKAGNGIVHLEHDLSYPISRTYLKSLKD